MEYTVYILRTSTNALYTGITNNLDKRLAEHKNGTGAKYMRSFTSFTLVYTEQCKDKSTALKREAAIKKLNKKQKEELVLNFTK
jgi:putative endonuclease